VSTKNAARLFLIGFSGSGKSVVGERIAARWGWQLMDTDAIVEEQQGKEISDIFETCGEPSFRQMETAAVKQIIDQEQNTIVATGGGLPTISGMLPMLSEHGVTLYLRATLDELWTRLSIDPEELAKRPLLQNAGRRGLEGQWRNREHVYQQAQVHIQTDGMSVDEVVDALAITLSRSAPPWFRKLLPAGEAE